MPSKSLDLAHGDYKCELQINLLWVWVILQIDDNIGFCFVLPQEGTPLIRVTTKATSITKDKIDSFSKTLFLLSI